MRPRLLLVDPRPHYVQRMKAGWSDLAAVEGYTDFAAARKALLNDPPDFLVTNLRLGAYNGLHLVYLSQMTKASLRAIVYSDTPDPWALREIQALGAFFERGAALPVALPAYLGMALPASDRRDGMVADRRHSYRGGRRSADVDPALEHPPSAEAEQPKSDAPKDDVEGV